MMLTALFFVWLQMSAQSQNCNVIMNGSMICQDHQGYIMEYGGEFVAADETEGKPPNLAIFGVSTWDDGPPHKPWDEVDGQDWPRKFVPAESVDVPAVQVGGHLGFDGCGQSACFDHWVTDYTCTDKSRVLLTSEDGKKHCIKF